MLFGANFAFNDTHRKLLYQVQQAYYELLNASGQEEAARASLVNAQAAEQAAEERLKNGLATLPDVLEARSASAQAEFDLQAVLGTQEIFSTSINRALATKTKQTVIGDGNPVRVAQLCRSVCGVTRLVKPPYRAACLQAYQTLSSDIGWSLPRWPSSLGNR